MSFLFGEKTEEVSLLIDIGNGSMSAAFVLFVKGAQPRPLFALQVPFGVMEKPSSEKLLDTMNTLLDTMLGNMMKQGFIHEYWKNHRKKISRVLVTFSSPWFISKTKTIHIVEENTFTITQPFIEGLLKKEENLLKDELSQTKYGKIFEHDIDVIEKSLVQIKINGYAIDHAIGKKTKTFDASLCMSVMATNITEKVFHTIFKHTHLSKEHVHMHSFPVVSFSVIRDLFPMSKDFIIMDVTGEVTDITLVQDSVVSQIISFPSGRNFIIRQISKVFDVSPEISESMLRIYISGKAEQSIIEKMDKVFIDIEKEWSLYLEDVLVELSPDVSLPSKVFMTADADVASLYVNFLKMSKTDSTATFRKHISITRLDSSALSHSYASDPRVADNEFIAMLSVFFNKIIFG